MALYNHDNGLIKNKYIKYATITNISTYIFTIFRTLEVVDRGSETQLQVAENLSAQSSKTYLLSWPLLFSIHLNLDFQGLHILMLKSIIVWKLDLIISDVQCRYRHV